MTNKKQCLKTTLSNKGKDTFISFFLNKNNEWSEIIAGGTSKKEIMTWYEETAEYDISANAHILKPGTYKIYKISDILENENFIDKAYKVMMRQYGHRHCCSI